MAVSRVAGEVEVADAAAVHAAPGRLELLDELHGAWLGRAGQGARREAGREDVVRRAALGARCPTTVLTMCITWLNRSTDMKSTTSTVPGAQTRPRSLRPRSTSIRCSARSFGSASRSAASAASSSGVAPRHRVPAIGCIIARPPVDLDQRLRAGADDVEAVEAQQVHVRARVGGAQHPVDVERVGVGRSS